MWGLFLRLKLWGKEDQCLESSPKSFRCVWTLEIIFLTCLRNAAMSSSVPAMSPTVLLVEELSAGYLGKSCAHEVGRREWFALGPFQCIDSSAGSLFGVVIQTWQVAANGLLISMSEADCPLTLSGDRTTADRNIPEIQAFAGVCPCWSSRPCPLTYLFCCLLGWGNTVLWRYRTNMVVGMFR